MIFLKKPPQNVSSYQTAVALITEMLLAGTKGLKLGVLLSSGLIKVIHSGVKGKRATSIGCVQSCNVL